jgi:hypothetical protein
LREIFSNHFRDQRFSRAAIARTKLQNVSPRAVKSRN